MDDSIKKEILLMALEECNFSEPGDTTFVGGFLFHPVVGEFKWKAIGNGDRVFEGCSVQGWITDIKKHHETC